MDILSFLHRRQNPDCRPEDFELRPFSDAIQNSSDPISDERAIEILSRGLGCPSLAGPVVSEETAMRISTFYRCVSLIAGTIAALPCEVFERDPHDRDKRTLALDHPVFWLVHNEPSPMMTANTFWKSFLYGGCTRGNGYALIGRNRNGVPRSISWLPPSRVTPQLSPEKTRIFYAVHLVDGTRRVYDQDDVLHYPFIGFNGLEGRAPLECAREAVGLSAAGEGFNAEYFTGANASDLVLNYEKAISSEQAKLIQETIENQRTGAGKMRRPLIVWDTKDVKKINFSAEDTQLIESRGFQVEDICRFFGVPPHLVGHTTKSTSWGTGIEEQTLGFVKFVLRDILKGIEQEIDRKLIRNPRYLCKFNLDALLRADSKGRSEFYKAALGGNQLPGFMTINEIRRLENLPPVPGGDQVYIPVTNGDRPPGNDQPDIDPDEDQRRFPLIGGKEVK